VREIASAASARVLLKLHAMRFQCSENHDSRRIVLTGGPGAGKTATLEVVRKALCKRIVVLPESAGIIFRGGFPRGEALGDRQHAQRAIYFVQRELESLAMAKDAPVVLCDRGTIDGLAYWPVSEDMWSSVGSSLEAELARYHAVIHLRTPPSNGGYNHVNPLRTETAEQAAAIDARIAQAWSRHPRRFEVPATPDFFAKVLATIEIIEAELPPCCRRRTDAHELLMRSA
jgi:predicted ATPase